MNRTFFLLILLISQSAVKAQSSCEVCNVFNQIRLENITSDLKDSILKYPKYYPQTNEPDYIEYYTLNIDSVKEQARIEFGFESGQSAYATDEIKLFKKTGGSYKVIYSHCTGANVILNQDRLIIYDYDVDTQLLKPDTITSSIFDYNLKDFFKHGAQDSVIADFETNIVFTYDLFYTDKYDVEMRLVCFLLSVNLMENENILGDTIGFKWINDRFVKTKPYF